MSTNGLTEDEILQLIETAEGEDLVELAEMLEAKIKIDGWIKELDQLSLDAASKKAVKKPKSKEATDQVDDMFIYEHTAYDEQNNVNGDKQGSLRITWTKNSSGSWTPTASRIFGEGEAGVLRGQHSKELETAIWFSISSLKKHLDAKVGGHGKAGKSSHPYKKLILKHMKNSKREGNSLKQFLLQWEANPLDGDLTLENTGDEKYKVADQYSESAPKPYTFKTFGNYWGECK